MVTLFQNKYLDDLPFCPVLSGEQGGAVSECGISPSWSISRAAWPVSSEAPPEAPALRWTYRMHWSQ